MVATASALKAFNKYKRFAVATHVNPDADALGASLSLVLFLKLLGKEARFFNQDPCPLSLSFMPQVRLYEHLTPEIAFHPEVCVVLDCGELDRVGKVAGLAGRALIVNIDHHVTNTRFGKVNVVDPKASSTSEILYRVIQQGKGAISRDMAELLYLGILTDTGSFAFDSTTSATHAVVADLMRHKFSVSDLYRQVYETLPSVDLCPFFALLNKIELLEGGQVAILEMSRRSLTKFSAGLDVKDKIFHFLRSVKGLELIVLLTEQDRRKVRINFRSRSVVDVASLAEKFGGGGHKRASGGFVNTSLKGARASVLKEIRKTL